MKSSVKERFLRYLRYDTQSDESAAECPSTAGQRVFARALVDELQSIGVKDAQMDANGYVTGTIPANLAGEAPVLGFIAHMDTSPDLSGRDVRPRVVEKYDGGDIALNEDGSIVLRPEQFAELKKCVGQDIIVTDGSTLLGADDKAGVAEIVTMADILLHDPAIRHGTIRVGFTPDEEIGRGADLFDVRAFGADYAYTVDGGGLGELEYENFNAAAAAVSLRGVSIHPGSAKGQMLNALLMAMEFHCMLPPFENPACTEGYEGFSHLHEMTGDVEHTVMYYLIRDHDRGRFIEKKERFAKIADYLNDKYGGGAVSVEITDSYYNMREKILPHYHLIDTAREAMEQLGVEPAIVPVRGGTDGARLSYMGLPCPNLFTGGRNFHGRYEYIPVQAMEKAVAVLVRIAELTARK